MIAMILPTRKRPKELRRFVESVEVTAKNPIEIVCYFDDDDRASLEAVRDLNIKTLVGPRIRLMGKYWNLLMPLVTADICCQANDDFVMKTPGWDEQVEAAFGEVPDRILMVHGNDMGGHFGRFGPAPIVHKRWIECLGYLTAPYFCSDNCDAWTNDVANELGRRRYIPFEMEHLHPAYGKAPLDDTYNERMQRHAEDNPDQLYWDLQPERMKDVERLRALMFSDPDTRGWVPQIGDPQRSVGKCPKCGVYATVIVQGTYICNGCGHTWTRL